MVRLARARFIALQSSRKCSIPKIGSYPLNREFCRKSLPSSKPSVKRSRQPGCPPESAPPQVDTPWSVPRFPGR